MSGEINLVIYSSKRKKILSTGLLKACHLGFWYNVMPMDMYHTWGKKSSKSNSNFSLKRMQCSIFSNTVYKAKLHRWYLGEPAKADPSLKQWQASCIFTTAPFQSILMVQTLLCADLITLHIKRKKYINKYIYLPVKEASTVADFYYGSVAFPISKWQLLHFCSTLSYRCEKDVQFKQMDVSCWDSKA